MSRKEKYNSIKCKNNSTCGVSITFTASDNLKPYFRTNEFRVEYSTELVDLPHGIAVIPFVCNVLPIVWLTDAVLELDELDEDFYNCIEKLKTGYEEMYPNLQFKGKIECKRIVKYQPLCNENRSLTFFSGGVDAFATLFAHIDEKPTLFSICGADIKLNNKAGWSAVMHQVEDVSKTFELQAIQCYSNFREFIDEEKLCELVISLGSKDDYWHGFQHGIGLIGHAAPLAYAYGHNMNYIASTYTLRDRPHTTCASDPRIDNHVEFCGAKVHHDQFEYDRQEKIKHIVAYCNEYKCRIRLRVCWVSDGGENCCVCEKCIRTMYGLMAEKADPKEYGFNNVNINRLHRKLKYRVQIPPICMPLWDDIIRRLNEQEKGTTQIEWLRGYSAERLNNNLIKKMLPAIKRVIRKIRRC